ncbi:MAG: hypothetical protein HC853_01105 [Anaerolineae bacterium]|nr:hypothetical protein [Anaerolineae bacterium]
MLGIFVARGLNSPTTEVVHENLDLKGQIATLNQQLSQKDRQIDTLQQQIESPPVVQSARVGFEFGWRIALLILFFGGAVAAVSFLFVQARLIRPNRNGQFPVVVDSTLGQTAYSDLNLQVAQTSVIEKPSLRSQLAAQLRGKPESRLAIASHQAMDPQNQFEVKRGTQLVQVMIAASAPTHGWSGAEASSIKQQGRALATSSVSALLAPVIRAELPPVNVIELQPGQEQQVARIFQKNVVFS